MKAFEIWNEYSITPLRSRASIPKENIILNREISMEIMWLNLNPLLHIVSVENESFINEKSSYDLWNDLIDCWVSVYNGFPDAIRFDRESSFASAKCRENTKDVEIKLQLSGNNEKKSIVNGEIYHYPLRIILDIVIIEEQHIHDRIVSIMAIKSINDTKGRNGVVTSLLVYGVLSPFPATSEISMIQKERFQALKSARAEMETIEAEPKHNRVLKSKLPLAIKIEVFLET